MDIRIQRIYITRDKLNIYMSLPATLSHITAVCAWILNWIYALLIQTLFFENHLLSLVTFMNRRRYIMSKNWNSVDILAISRAHKCPKVFVIYSFQVFMLCKCMTISPLNTHTWQENTYVTYGLTYDKLLSFQLNNREHNCP